ncbi:peroxisomal biogenesis factor 11 [Achaetomium macrosporum]|uniref:Peroxisomal biogenesis factor 11 n=1 Tax=Achaetomium macrosporum TaxID=79813 RepID=A0AAN7CA80_9PEZI|nr:peroxisomal biogenesis factor 11 [Achaetomium macrosporum]
MTVRVSTFDQFVKFGTDAYGLERLLRLIQGLIQLLLSLPVLRLLLLRPLLSAQSYSTVTPVLLQALRKRISSIRQAFRIFRFLDSFSSAWSVWSLPPHQDGVGGGWAPRVERWMDFGAKSFTGMYLLLESMTFVESLAVPGLSVWGEQRAAELAMDGQRFWFVGLVCGILAGGLRLAGREGATEGKMAEKRPQGEVEKGRERKRRTFRRLVADAMDLAVPGSVVGWVRLEPAMVSLLMFGSTVLTGMEVWERCGREAAATKKAIEW